jgi:hypothetical protein
LASYEFLIYPIAATTGGRAGLLAARQSNLEIPSTIKARGASEIAKTLGIGRKTQ